MNSHIALLFASLCGSIARSIILCRGACRRQRAVPPPLCLRFGPSRELSLCCAALF